MSQPGSRGFNERAGLSQSSMIRVLHVFGSLLRGGAETRTVELMPLLRAKGVQFDFCTLQAGPGQFDDTIHRWGGAIHACPLRPAWWSFPLRFLRLLREQRYEVVHSHVYYTSGALVALAQRAGVAGRVVHFRSTGDGKPSKLGRVIYRKVMKRLSQAHATAIVAVSRAAIEGSWGPRWADDPRTEVIYNGLDLKPFAETAAPAAVRAELGLPADSILAISIGRFELYKGQDVVVRAMALAAARQPHLHLLLVGDGSKRESLERQARDEGMGNQVHFLGVRDDVPRLLKASDVMVHASRREGLPGVVIEAVAAELPVVAADLPGVREVAAHTDLIAIVARDAPQEMAQAIGEVLERRKGAGWSRKPFPAVFDMQRCAEAVFAMYQRAMKLEGAPRRAIGDTRSAGEMPVS